MRARRASRARAACGSTTRPRCRRTSEPYEELDLLRPIERQSGANRRYTDQDIERLRLIRRLREDVGLSLAEIKTYLDVEDVREVVKSEYEATADPEVQLALLERAEPVIRRRMAMLEQKLARVAALRAEDEAILERIAARRAQHLAAVAVGTRR